MARVVLVGNLAQLTGSVAEFNLSVTSVKQMFEQLTELHPTLARHLDEGVAVAIDGQIYQDALLEPIGPDSEVFLLPQIAGGSTLLLVADSRRERQKLPADSGGSSEHHRVAFLDFGPLTPRDPSAGSQLMVKGTDQPGLHHVAFTFRSMGEFLDNYVRIKEKGIRPFFCVNHGPTTSMYYRDPDGNRIELQIDNFATAEEGQAWMHSPAFERNPIGVEFDPDELVKEFRAGVPVAELVARD